MPMFMGTIHYDCVARLTHRRLGFLCYGPLFPVSSVFRTQLAGNPDCAATYLSDTMRLWEVYFLCENAYVRKAPLSRRVREVRVGGGYAQLLPVRKVGKHCEKNCFLIRGSIALCF